MSRQFGLTTPGVKLVTGLDLARTKAEQSRQPEQSGRGHTAPIASASPELSSRPVLDGGTNTQGSSRGANAIQFGADNVIRLPVSTSPPANLPLPAALYSRGEPPLKLSEFSQSSLDVLAFFAWVLLPISLWGSLAFLGWVLFFM